MMQQVVIHFNPPNVKGIIKNKLKYDDFDMEQTTSLFSNGF
jgi:hypothetical protein